jgi:hypothetical protein
VESKAVDFREAEWSLKRYFQKGEEILVKAFKVSATQE